MTASTLTPRTLPAPGSATQSRSRSEQGTYVHNLLVDDCLAHLPAGLEHPSINAFKTYLREHLPQNSAQTRLRYARYIAQRYSKEGVINQSLARFLREVTDPVTRREVLFFETLNALPLLADITGSWLAGLPSEGAHRTELVAFLETRVGARSAEKIASEAVKGLRKFACLSFGKGGTYLPVFRDPPAAALTYVLSVRYPEPTAVSVESFKADHLWRAALWRTPALEHLLNEKLSRAGVVRVSQLDNYYSFTLQGSGAELLEKAIALAGGG